MSPVRNPFRQQIMKRTFAALVDCYTTKHRDLFRPDGSRNMGNAWAINFWRGYDNSRPEQWDAESRKMVAYACWRAGRIVNEAEKRPA